MAGENHYKEFDTASIIPAADSVVLLGRYRLRKRDLLLGGTAVVALLTCLILAIILGVVANRGGGQMVVAGFHGSPNCTEYFATTTTSQLPETEPTITTTTLKQTESNTETTKATLKPPETHPCNTDKTTTMKPPETQPGSTATPTTVEPVETLPCSTATTATLAPTPQQCETVPCLKASTYALTSMDTSVDPCEDFYTFSCGKYAEVNPPKYFWKEENPLTKIAEENEVKLLVLLWEQTSENHEHSYERKLKQFLRSCMDHFQKFNKKGQPFIDQIVTIMGGWYLLNDWNISQFNFQRTMTDTNARFMAHTLFYASVVTKNHNWNEAIIQIDEGYTFFLRFYDNATLRHYVGNMTSLLQSDFGFQSARADEVRQQVVDDVVEIHNRFRQMEQSFYDSDAHRPEKTKTLAELNSDMNNTFNFTSFLRELFDDPAVTIDSNTRVAVVRPTYFPKLGSLLQEYLQTDLGKRKLHNFIMFWLLETYHKELSWEYISVYDQMTGYSLANAYADSTYDNCFYTINKNMREALNALYVRKYVDTSNKDEADGIMRHLVAEMVERVDSATWLTPADKVNAKRVVREGIYKIGFNDLLKDTDYMESLYRQVNISLNNFFGNVLNLLEVERQENIDQLKHPDDRSLWYLNVYTPIILYYIPWRELLATAAAMQSPLFDHQGPDYYNYGSIGTMLAVELMNALNENSNIVELDGSGYGSWWSNETRNNYNQLKDCAVDVQNTLAQLENRSLSFFITEEDPSDNWEKPTENERRRCAVLIKDGKAADSDDKVNITERNIRYATELLSRVAGLRLTYLAYKEKERENGQELMPAGIHRYTADQMFFVARAQTSCQTAPSYMQILQSLFGHYSAKDKINLEMSQVPEFAQAFSCSSGQRMKAEKTCALL